MRFTIRDLLWLMVVAGLILGWWRWWYSLPVTKDGLIHGRVLVSGKPIDSGRVFLQSPDGQFRGTQFAKGCFSLQGIPFGKYRVTFEGENVPPNKFDAELDDNCQALGVTFDIRPNLRSPN